MEQIYLIINPSNVVENIIVWNEENEWKLPAGYTFLLKNTTPSKIWSWNLSLETPSWELIQTTGMGDINDIWDGVTLTTTLPKPTNSPTVTSGTMKV